MSELANQVFTAATTNSSSTIHMCRSNAVHIETKGTWGGAAIGVKYTISGNESYLTALVGVSYTVDDTNKVETVPGAKIQLVITGATGTTNLNAWIQDIPKNT